MQPNGASLSIRHAVKTHRAAEAVFTLQVPELELPAGCVCVVTGRSGCGKTTLLDVLGCISAFDTCERFTITHGKRNYELSRAGAMRRAALRKIELDRASLTTKGTSHLMLQQLANACQIAVSVFVFAARLQALTHVAAVLEAHALRNRHHNVWMACKRALDIRKEIF